MDKILYILDILTDKAYNYIKYGLNMLYIYLNITDLIYRAVQVLRENLYWIRISAQDARLMEPVEP